MDVDTTSRPDPISQNPCVVQIMQNVDTTPLGQHFSIPVQILQEIGEFARGEDRKCDFPTCNVSSLVYDKYIYAPDHSNATHLGYFWCRKKDNYFCVGCGIARNVLPCRIVNKQICGVAEDKLCNELIIKQDIDWCSSEGNCNERWANCTDQCVENWVMECGICQQKIGEKCMESKYFERCDTCDAIHCIGCVYGIGSGDVSNICYAMPTEHVAVLY